MFVDIYKSFRDRICPNDNKDGCPFDYIGTCPYFIEMKDSNVEINSCDQCKILLKNKGSRSDIRSREPIYCKKCGNDVKDVCYLDDGNNIICPICVAHDVNNHVQKSNAYCRNKNLDPDSTTGKGYITEVLVAKFLGIKTCFDITGNFNHKAFDMYEDEDWGIINVKGSSLHYYNGYLIWYFNTDKNITPDFFFCIGYDEYMKNVECIYIIPNEEYVSRLKGIEIYKGGRSKWKVFKESKEEVKKWNELFHSLKLDDCPVLRNR